MRKRRKNNKTIISLVFLLIISICFLMFLTFNQPDKKQNLTENNKKVIKEPEKRVISKLSLAMVGDTLAHGAIVQDAKIDNGYDFSYIFTDIKDYIKSYDLAFYNQETVFGGELKGRIFQPNSYYGSKGYMFNTPTILGDTMLDMGFNLVSLANNHMLDMGEEATLNSRKYWKAKDNVLAVGSYESFEDREEVIIKEKNGIKYTLLAYTDVVNFPGQPTSSKAYFLNRYDEDIVAKDIDKVRDKVDLLMVSMHWGTEYSNQASAKQKEIAEYLSKLGVDIIIGHHPHVLQPIEFIDNTLVIYSLGNFIAAQETVDKQIGVITSLDITKTDDNGKITIELSDVTAKLTYTYSKGYKNFKLIPIADKYAKYLPNDYKTKYDYYKKLLTEKTNRVNVLSLNDV